MKKTLVLLTFFAIWLCIISTKIISSASERAAYDIGGEIFKSYSLNDKEHTDRFVVYEFTNGGYLIYDLINCEITEYSLKSDSPYRDITNELFYFGPTNYFYFDGIEYKDFSNQKINIDKFSNLKRNSINTRSLSVIENEYSSAEVPYSKYFKLLDGITNPFPNNEGDDCGYVAASILLSYYACFQNPNIISSEYISPVNNVEQNIEQWDYVPCASQEFMHHLQEDFFQDSSVSISIDLAIERYLFYTDISYTHEHSGLVVPTYSSLKSRIDQGIPCILFGNYNYVDNDSGYITTAGNHAVIVYGYDYYSDNNKMLLTHFGWDGYSEVWINHSSCIFGPTYYITFDEHIHSNYTFVNNHKICWKDNYHVSPFEEVYTSLGDLYHSVDCECGYHIKIENHQYSSITTYARPSQRCIKCGQTKI